jgi:PhnB protein
VAFGLSDPSDSLKAHAKQGGLTMGSVLNPYLNFRDTAKQAMEFYEKVFGGELTLSTFKEFQVSEDPAEQDKIMHGMLKSPNGFVLMGADTPNNLDFTPGTNYSVSLSGDDEPELRGYWDKLSAGGTVTMPMNKAPWGDSFGMCIDKFGVSWLINISPTS